MSISYCGNAKICDRTERNDTFNHVIKINASELQDSPASINRKTMHDALIVRRHNSVGSIVYCSKHVNASYRLIFMPCLPFKTS